MLRNDGLFGRNLVLVEEAAEALNMAPQRLRGFIVRNNLFDPIGDLKEVYGWSCRALADRLGLTADEAPAVGGGKMAASSRENECE